MKTFLKIFSLLLLTATIVAGVIWANLQADEQVCHKIVLNVENAELSSLATQRTLLDELTSHGIRPLGKRFSKINTHEIETILNKSEYFENVECHLMVKDFIHGDQVSDSGILVINATKIVPVMRVFDGNHSYYVNRVGKTMKASPDHRADVPIVYGHFTEKFPPTRLLPMIEYVEQDSTLKPLVSMYHVADTSNIFVVPNIVGHVVNMGHVDGYKSKFQKLLKFYQKVMPEKGWFTYDTISVKWDYRIVATRHQKPVPQVVDYSLDDEPDIDIDMLNNP